METHTHQTKESTLGGLEGFFDTYLRVKAPWQLPVKAKEFIVKYGPWISLVLLVIGAITIIPLLILALGLNLVAMPFLAATGYVQNSMWGFVHIIITLIVLIMEGIAIPGLLKRRLSGWHMLYHAMLLSALGSLISLDIISFVVGLVISMFILFQIRDYYK